VYVSFLPFYFPHDLVYISPHDLVYISIREIIDLWILMGSNIDFSRKRSYIFLGSRVDFSTKSPYFSENNTLEKSEIFPEDLM